MNALQRFVKLSILLLLFICNLVKPVHCHADGFVTRNIAEDHFDHEEKEETKIHSKPKLLLISFDGFRWDYLQRLPKLNNFSLIYENGMIAKNGILNEFVTKTFPNHWSIVTGLHEESHGIL